MPRFDPIRGRLLGDDPDSMKRGRRGEHLSDEDGELTEERSSTQRSPWMTAAGVSVYWIRVVTAMLLVAVPAGGWWCRHGHEATTDPSASVQERRQPDGW